MAMPAFETLRTTELFESVSDRDLQALTAMAQVRTYVQGEMILGAADERDGIFVVHAGETRLYWVSLQGHEITLAVFQSGDVFGLSFLSPQVPSKSAFQATVSETVVCHLPREVLRDLIASHPVLALAVIDCLGCEVAEMSDRAEDLALHTVRMRLARELVREVERRGDPFLDLKHDAIAARIGSTRLEVTRNLRYFRERKVIRSKPRRPGITVQDMEKLLAYGNELS